MVLHRASSWGSFSFAWWSSMVPLVMTSRLPMYACTYSRASLGPIFLLEIEKCLLDHLFLWRPTGIYWYTTWPLGGSILMVLYSMWVLVPLRRWSLSFCSVVFILGRQSVHRVHCKSAMFHTVISFFGIINVREAHCNDDYFFVTPMDTSLFITFNRAALCIRCIGYGLI